MEITVHFAARAIDAVRSIAAEEILPRYRGVVSDSAGAAQPLRKADGRRCRGGTAPLLGEWRDWIRAHLA